MKTKTQFMEQVLDKCDLVASKVEKHFVGSMINFVDTLLVTICTSQCLQYDDTSILEWDFKLKSQVKYKDLANGSINAM